MASSVRPTFRARTCAFDRVPARGHCQGRRSQGTCLNEAASRLGSEKANPSEPIEVKPLRISDMRKILRKRTHWSYLACFEVITAKERSNSGNSVRHAPGLAPRFPVKAGPESTMPQSDPGMSFILRRKGFVGALTHPDSCSQGAARSAMRPEDVICIVSTSPY